MSMTPSGNADHLVVAMAASSPCEEKVGPSVDLVGLGYDDYGKVSLDVSSLSPSLSQSLFLSLSSVPECLRECVCASEHFGLFKDRTEGNCTRSSPCMDRWEWLGFKIIIFYFRQECTCFKFLDLIVINFTLRSCGMSLYLKTLNYLVTIQ